MPASAVPVDVGDRVTVTGKLAGTHSYPSRGGENLTVPRIQGAYLLP